MTRHSVSQARGFSLLEVLVAVVILSVGLLALASLQLSLIRSSSDSKSQTTALALAKDKLESLRDFQTMSDYVALTNSSAPITAAGTTYTVGATITRFVYDSDSGTFLSVANTTSEAALSADGGHTYLVGRDYKKASVNVTWKDAANNSRFVTLEDILDGLDPADSAKVAKTTSSTSPRSVKVVISDPANEEGVIPIAIGDNTDTAATNPKPVVDSGANETRFDILTYAGLSGGVAQAQAKVETVVIRCTCDTANKPTDTNARGYRPTYWNGLRYVAPTLTTYVPDAGHATIAKKDPSESPYCDTCCRDHEDPSGVTGAKFDPFRSGAHDHYNYDNTGALVKATNYLEACRLIRVDGIIRTAADFNDEYFNLVKTKKVDGLTPEYVPTAKATSAYQNIVLAYLDTKIVSNTVPTTYNTALTAAQIKTIEDNTTDSTNTFHINDPSSVDLDRDSGSSWLHSRGLYIDYLEPSALAVIAAAKQACLDNSCTTAQTQAAVLKVTPFTSINVSELTDWTPTTENSGYIAVTDGTFYSGGNLPTGAPVRGYVKPLKANLPATAVTVNGVATMRVSNSALAPTILTTAGGAIDTTETSSTGTKTDTQPYAIAAGGVSVSGGDFTVNLNNLVFQGSPSVGAPNALCGAATKGGSKPNPWTCSSTNLKVATIVTVGTYNYATPGTSTDSTLITTQCTDVDGSSTLKTYGSGTNPVTAAFATNTCRNYPISTATVDGTSALSITPTNDGNVGETSAISFGMVNPSSVIQVNFGTPVDTVRPITCKWKDSVVTTCTKKKPIVCTDKTTTTYTTFTTPCTP